MKTLIVLISLLVSTAAVAQTRTSVVMVRAYNEQEKQWYHGTGFFIGRDVVLTNYHVVNPRIKNNVVVVIDNNNIKGEVFFEDSKEDLALVRIKTSGHKPFRLCNYAKNGDGVKILTRNTGYKSKNGIVSHIGFDRIYVIADIAKGDSGSPVVKGMFSSKCVIGVVKSLSSNRTTSTIDFQTVKDFIERSNDDN